MRVDNLPLSAEKQTKNGRLSTLVLRGLETVALQEAEG